MNNNETVKIQNKQTKQHRIFQKKRTCKEETVQENTPESQPATEAKKEEIQKTKMTLLMNILAWMSTCYKNGWQN